MNICTICFITNISIQCVREYYDYVQLFYYKYIHIMKERIMLVS